MKLTSLDPSFQRCEFRDGKEFHCESDVDWESRDGRYRVRIEGQWWDVPEDAVIVEPNRGRPDHGVAALLSFDGQAGPDRYPLLHAGEHVMSMLIQQREKSDCAICTIAMALGRSYEDVMQAAIDAEAYESGVGTRSEYAIIECFGLEQMRDFRTLHRGGEGGILSAEFFRHFSWGRRAILAVPSLNIEGSFHSVYWTGSELRDPCTLKTYSRWDELKPDEIILFADAGPHPKVHR